MIIQQSRHCLAALLYLLNEFGKVDFSNIWLRFAQKLGQGILWQQISRIFVEKDQKNRCESA
jgi:hypothetical protein